VKPEGRVALGEAAQTRRPGGGGGFGSAIAVVVLFAVTCVVQFVAIARLSPQASAPFDPDFYEYQSLARSLSASGVFAFPADWSATPALANSSWKYLYETSPTTIREPGYPALMALVHSVLGDENHSLRVVLILCNALTVVVCFRLGAFLFSWQVGLLAAVGCMLDPSMVYTAARLGREPILALLTTTGLLLAFAAVRRKAVGWALLAGAVFALLAYFKETGHVTCGVLAAWMLLLAWRQRLPLWKPALGMIACTLVLALPWMARNSLLRDRPVTMSSIAPLTMSNGMAAAQTWASTQPDDVREALDPWRAANPADAERRLLHRTLAYFRANPGEAIGTMAFNAGLFWSPLGRYSLKPWRELSVAERTGLLYHGFLLSVSLMAFWSFRRNPYAQGVVLLLLVMTLLHSPFDAGPRYRAAFEPVLLAYAAEATARAVASAPRKAASIVAIRSQRSRSRRLEATREAA